MTIADIQAVTNILQNLTLTGATLVAAWWAYTTLGYKEKSEEFLAIARKIVEIHSHIEGSTTIFDLYKTLAELGSIDLQKLERIKQGAEVRLNALRSELEDLQVLSLRVPIVFRVLRIGEYQLELITLGGVERWGEKSVKEKLLRAKLNILTDINKEINTHSNFIRKLSVKILNLIYHIKNYFKNHKG